MFCSEQPARHGEKYVIPSLPQTGSNIVELQLQSLEHIPISVNDLIIIYITIVIIIIIMILTHY